MFAGIVHLVSLGTLGSRCNRGIWERLIATCVGFCSLDEPVFEGCLAFSLSVQNRRKSRAGLALESHLEALFIANDLQFSRGAITENGNRPDFLFPGVAAYQNPGFPSSGLMMLGAKSTVKERWRQVLSEAARIENKHLLTLEPGVSEAQTTEMKAKNLQLVVPSGLFRTYKDRQQAWLIDVRQFIALAKAGA